jgi:hypothetical protein
MCLVCGQVWKFCRGRDVAISLTTMFEQIFPFSQYCIIVDIQTIASEAQDDFLPAAFASILHVHVRLTEVTHIQPSLRRFYATHMHSGIMCNSNNTEFHLNPAINMESRI